MVPGSPPSGADRCNNPRQSVSLPNIPLAFPDQTLESIAALTGLANGLSLGRETIDRVFGSPNIRTDLALHAGFRRAYEVLRGLGYNSYKQFAESHGFLPFFRPFVPTETYERAEHKLESNSVTGLWHLLAMSNFTLRRGAYRYCFECITESIRQRGYACARRTLQVRGVDFCPEHGTPLVTTAPGVRLEGSRSCGLIVPSADDDWRQALVPITPLSGAPAWHRFGVWVDAVLNGEFPILSVELRTALMQRRINEIPREQGDPSSLGGRCERYLIRTYGSDVLEKLELPVLDGITQHWPAFLIFGTAYMEHPLANLLVISALFHSPAEFAMRAVDIQGISGPVVAVKPKPAARPRGVTLDISILRAFYREHSIHEIARQRGLDHGTVESICRLHPDLQERREQFHWRQLRKRMRQKIDKFLQTSPRANRSSAEKHDRSVLDWLRRHDRDWIDERLPTKRPPRPLRSTNDDLALIDARVQRQLVEVAKHHINIGGIERVTRAFLTKYLTPHERTMFGARRLPRSEHQIIALVEARETHLKRVERHLNSLLLCGDIQRARQHAYAAISALGRQKDYLAMIIHAMIPDRLHVESIQAVA